MNNRRWSSLICGLLIVVFAVVYLATVLGRAQTSRSELRPDLSRALKTRAQRGTHTRKNSYQPQRSVATKGLRPRATSEESRQVARLTRTPSISADAPIAVGTPLYKVLHTSQLSMTSAAGTDEELVDRTLDLVADDQTTFDNAGGSFDIAVGKSGTRYEVFSGTSNNNLVGVLVAASDTNGDYISDTSLTFDLRRDFMLPSAAAVVTGNASDGKEFVVVCSSGFFNSADDEDPNNEPSPGVLLFVRNPLTGGFDDSQTKVLVQIGNDKLFNANAMALMPNNDLLIADFKSDELRIIRDTNGDRMPDTLDDVPYYSFQFADDAPLDIAVNSRGVVFSHSEGTDTLLLAIYDDNGDGRADHDEVAVAGLSIDNNLFLHGMGVDSTGTIYLIEDATSAFDDPSGNLDTARIDAFRDPLQDGFPENGKIFADADASNLGLSGIGFGPESKQINNTGDFVRQHYLDFLSREPDPPGFNFWVNNIDSCGSNQQCREVKRVDTSAAFFLSIEFQQTGFLVYRLFKTSFPVSSARPRGLPRFHELLTGSRTIGSGVVVGEPNWPAKLEANTVAYIDSFVARQEFQTAYPASLTPAQYVDNLNTLAGGALSTSERNTLVNGLTGGQETRATVLRKIADDVDFRNAEISRAFVLMQYHGYLRRNPDDPPDLNFNGYDFWLNKLNQFGGDYRSAEMVKAFISSDEYKARYR